MMLDLVRKSGVQFAAGRHLKVPGIRAVKGPYEYLHAEAESDMAGDPRRIRHLLRLEARSRHAGAGPAMRWRRRGGTTGSLTSGSAATRRRVG